MSVTGFNLMRRRQEALKNAQRETEQRDTEGQEVEREQTEEEIRKKGKELKIISYHNMGIEKLKAKIAEVVE